MEGNGVVEKLVVKPRMTLGVALMQDVVAGGKKKEGEEIEIDVEVAGDNATDAETVTKRKETGMVTRMVPLENERGDEKILGLIHSHPQPNLVQQRQWIVRCL